MRRHVHDEDKWKRRCYGQLAFVGPAPRDLLVFQHQPRTFMLQTRKKNKERKSDSRKRRMFPFKVGMNLFLALLRSDQTKTVNTEPFPSVQMAQLQLYVLQRYDLDLICKWR